MNWLRLLVAALGVAAFGLAAAIVLVPGVGSALPVDAAVAALGYDYLLAALLGVVAFVVTLLVLALRAVGGLDQATPPEPEGIEMVPRFGADVDAVVEDGLGIRARLFGDGREQVRGRVRETAVHTVARVQNCDRTEARRRVEDGAWIDDPEAAAFLAGGGGARAPGGRGCWRESAASRPSSAALAGRSGRSCRSPRRATRARTATCRAG